nr:MAG TPA: hypothetical protein [Caudoviricetes sp.]
MMFSEQCWVCEITDTVPLGSVEAIRSPPAMVKT